MNQIKNTQTVVCYFAHSEQPLEGLRSLLLSGTVDGGFPMLGVTFKR